MFVTHLFHPWPGREFELVVHRRTGSEDRVFFYDEGERLIALSASWTDFASPDPLVKIAAGRSLFQPADLCELAEQKCREVKGQADLVSIPTLVAVAKRIDGQVPVTVIRGH